MELQETVTFQQHPAGPWQRAPKSTSEIPNYSPLGQREEIGKMCSIAEDKRESEEALVAIE